MKTISFFSAICALTLASCSSDAPVTKPGAEKQALPLDTLETRREAETFYFGEVETLPNGLYQYASRLTGQIEEVWVLPGMVVQQGQALFSIQSSEFITLQQQFLESEAAYLAAKQEFQRTDTLFRLASVSKKNWELAQKAYAETQAAWQGAAARLAWVGLDQHQLHRAGISPTFVQKAKRKGTVQEVRISRGSPVLPDMLLISLVEPDAIQLRFRIPGASLSMFSTGMEIHFGQQSDQLTGVAEVTATAPMPDAQGFFSLYAKPTRWPASPLPAGEKLLVEKPTPDLP